MIALAHVPVAVIEDDRIAVGVQVKVDAIAAETARTAAVVRPAIDADDQATRRVAQSRRTVPG